MFEARRSASISVVHGPVGFGRSYSGRMFGQLFLCFFFSPRTTHCGRSCECASSISLFVSDRRAFALRAHD
jgi:hypothetical protein